MPFVSVARVALPGSINQPWARPRAWTCGLSTDAGVLARMQVEPDQCDFGANHGSVLIHQLRRRVSAISCRLRTEDLMFGDVAQMPGQQAAVPAPVPRRRRLIQSRQDGRYGRPSTVRACVRDTSHIPETPARAKRPRHLLTVAWRVPKISPHSLGCSIISATRESSKAPNAMPDGFCTSKPRWLSMLCRRRHRRTLTGHTRR